MAQQASDSLSGNMTTADQLAVNANAAWGPGDIQLGELNSRDLSPDFGWPSDYNKVTSGYSVARLDPVSGNAIKPHLAIDIQNPLNANVYSAADGVVSKVYNQGLGNGGNYIKIKHSNGFESGYFHTKTNLSVGSPVGKGFRIGFSDGSGRITGPHLHFTLSKSGKKINPLNYIK